MADRIHVSTEQLRNTVSKYVNCKNQLQLAYLQMSNAVRAVDSSWTGDASETYQAQFDQMYKNIEQTEAKAQDAIDEMNEIAQLMDELEQANQQGFANLEVGTSAFES